MPCQRERRPGRHPFRTRSAVRRADPEARRRSSPRRPAPSAEPGRPSSHRRSGRQSPRGPRARLWRPEDSARLPSVQSCAAVSGRVPSARRGSRGRLPLAPQPPHPSRRARRRSRFPRQSAAPALRRARPILRPCAGSRRRSGGLPSHRSGRGREPGSRVWRAIARTTSPGPERLPRIPGRRTTGLGTALPVRHQSA